MKRLSQVLTYVITAMIFICVSHVHAHELSTTYVKGSINNDNVISGDIRINILDLKEAVILDHNGNGELSWAEVLAAKPQIGAYFNERIRFTQNNETCRFSVDGALALQNLSQNTLLVVPFNAQCASTLPLDGISIEYLALFDVIANHKAIFSITGTNTDFLSVFDKDTNQKSFNYSTSNTFSAFFAFVYQGIFHILIGTDHILFLLTLLLTIVLVFKQKQWHPIQSKKAIVTRTLYLVTAFTIAHSITLSGTALGWLPVFGNWIEVVIAGSILFNVINNIFPTIHRLSIITFVFGLIHGMGFAGALSELGLPEQQKLLSVLAFNLGVELGQIMILLVSLPVLIALRNKPIYSKYLMPIASLSIGVLAIIWIAERVVNLPILSE
jgi:hypothetical protein